jgi:hypothetical protein
MPPPITILPNELLDGITAYLDQGSLNALTSTCKFTNPSATDALYRVYINRESPSEASFVPFLRTICERPDLAAKVRTLSVRGWRAECEVVTGAAWRGLTISGMTNNGVAKTNRRTGPCTPFCAAKTFRLFIDAAVRSGLIAKRESYPKDPLKTYPKWYTTLKAERDFLRLLGNGVEDSYILLLLALLPRLEALHIDGLTPYPTLDWYVETYKPVMRKVLTTTIRCHFLSRSTTALRTVKFLCLHGSMTRAHEPVVWSNLQILDLLPCLEDLYLTRMSTSLHQYSSNVLPTMKLQRVSLVDVGIQRQLLRKILVGQKKINTVRYKPSPWTTYSVPGGFFPGEVIEKYLSASQDSLKELSLFPTAPSRQTNLRIFNSLTALELPSLGPVPVPDDEDDPELFKGLLRGLIPSSLDTLCLRFLMLTPELRIFLEMLAELRLLGEFPGLRLIRLTFLQFREETNLTTFTGTLVAIESPEALLLEQVGGLFDRAGLQLEICQSD